MRDFLKKYWGYLFAFLLGAYSGKQNFRNVQTTFDSGLNGFSNGIEWVDHLVNKRKK